MIKNVIEVTPETLGRYLRGKREAKGLTRLQLAKKTGLTFVTLYKWETGERIPNTVSLLELLSFYGLKLGIFE